MPTLIELPKDIFRLILGSLADIKLTSLFILRGTCRTSNAIATDILDKTIPNHGPAIHTLLQSHFVQVLDSSKCSPNHVPEYDEPLAPFRDLPLAAHPDILAKYMHPDASWRHIPLAPATGSIVQRPQGVDLHCDWKDIHSVDGSHIYISTDYDGVSVGFFPHGITMGVFYDLMRSS